jgi:hypothetical protein
MAYESGGYCKCMSGYVMGEDFLGETKCVSGDSVCSEKYGWGSDYDSLSGSCECRYGYTWGKNLFGERECITEDQACKNQLGYNARSTFGGDCECGYGYVIDGGECKDGDIVCRADHGIHASYDTMGNECECDDGYTFDDTFQCVEKQHNVYFKLLDINPDDDKVLLIKSDYDSRKYIVRIGVGCFTSTISQYKDRNLVVNLGTDYEVDTWDTIVLQDDGQTCSIISKERTYDDYFPEPEEEEYYFIPPENTYPSLKPSLLNNTQSDKIQGEFSNLGNETPEVEAASLNSTDLLDSQEIPSTPSATITTEQTKKSSLFQRILNFFRNLF